MGGTGRLFSHFLWLTSFLWRKRWKVHNTNPSFFRLYNCPRIFITIGPMIKKKNRSTLTTMSRGDTMSAEKPFSWNLLVFTTSKDNSAQCFWATRLILAWKEAEWSALQKKGKFFFYSNFSNFQKNFNKRKLKTSMKNIFLNT